MTNTTPRLHCPNGRPTAALAWHLYSSFVCYCEACGDPLRGKVWPRAAMVLR